MWTDPIYNRTESEVESLKALNLEIGAVGWSNVTQAKRDQWLEGKGALNASDLNRIEANIEFIQSTIETSQGLAIEIESMHGTWDRASIPFITHIDSIRNNILDLKAGSYSNPDSPAIEFNDPMDWDDINDIEENLNILKNVLDNLSEIYLCGRSYCGQGTSL